jgi:hypothetical protein
VTWSTSQIGHCGGRRTCSCQRCRCATGAAGASSRGGAAGPAGVDPRGTKAPGFRPNAGMRTLAFAGAAWGRVGVWVRQGRVAAESRGCSAAGEGSPAGSAAGRRWRGRRAVASRHNCPVTSVHLRRTHTGVTSVRICPSYASPGLLRSPLGLVGSLDLGGQWSWVPRVMALVRNRYRCPHSGDGGGAVAGRRPSSSSGRGPDMFGRHLLRLDSPSPRVCYVHADVWLAARAKGSLATAEAQLGRRCSLTEQPPTERTSIVTHCNSLSPA